MIISASPSGLPPAPMILLCEISVFPLLLSLILDVPYLIGYIFDMSVYESIMQGLSEAVDYNQGKITARKTELTIKPVTAKTVEAWENRRNKPEGVSRRLLEIVRDDPEFLKRFQL